MLIARVKRVIASALVIGLATFIAPANSATIAGTKCTKIGATKTVSNIKYTCVKQGSKLVWNKGVSVVPSAKPSITPSPTPTPSDSPTAKPIEIKSSDFCNSADQGATRQTSAGELTCRKGSDDKFHWLGDINVSTPSVAPTISTTAKAGYSCTSLGQQVINGNDFLECRRIAGNQLVYTLLKNDFSPIANPASPQDPMACKITDARTNKIDPNFAIAYPVTPLQGFTNNGKMKIVVIGVDFQDAVGTGKPSELWNSDLQTTTEWLKWYTNGKVEYDFVTADRWLRLSQKYVNYTADNNAMQNANQAGVGGLTENQISQEIVNVAQDYVDLSNTTAIWIYQPPSVTQISTSGQWFNKSTDVMSSKYGHITAMMAAIGPDTYISKRPKWAYFLHENLHQHGLHGHSPKDPFRMGELSTADGWTLALLPWDMAIANWDKPGDIYCVDQNNLKLTNLTLVPLEREQDGLKSIFIKLNDHQVLVVESHRKDKWSQGTSPGQAAVMVNLVDTTISTSWDNPEGYKNPSSTGTYLKVDGANHGKHVPYGDPINNSLYAGGDVGVINGVGYSGIRAEWDLNYLMYPGESITYNGIKISLLTGGDNDTVRISKS